MLSNWHSGVQGPAVLFVKADWCPHCTQAKPQMEEVARTLAPAAIKVYAVDSERHKAYIQRLGVGGFPTILFLDEAGRRRTYNGERSAKPIVAWVCTTSGICSRNR